MSDVPEEAAGAMVRELYTFDLCLHFRAAYDTHMCAPCTHKEEHQECTRDLNCRYCINCFQCIGYDYTACIYYMDPDVCCPQKSR